MRKKTTNKIEERKIWEKEPNDIEEREKNVEEREILWTKDIKIRKKGQTTRKKETNYGSNQNILRLTLGRREMEERDENMKIIRIYNKKMRKCI